MLSWPPEQDPEACSWEALSDADVHVPPHANALAIKDGRLVQRVGASPHIALLPYKHTATASLPRVPDPESEVDVSAIWPPHGAPVDMRASIPPEFLAQRYDEAVWGSSPLALFPKQVLARARSLLSSAAYVRELRALLVAPEGIEHRYSQDADIEKRAQMRRGELEPVSNVLRQLQRRETQLQVVVGLELLPDAPDIEPLVDHHFDRLCIWNAVDGDSDGLSEFCATVVLPFFKSRCPYKTKLYIKRGRGTLKTRTRRTNKDSAEPVVLPSGGGLLRALQISGSTSLAQAQVDEPNATPAEAPRLPSKPRRAGTAVRSASHPLYTMANRHNTVEVRFKRSRRPTKATAASAAATMQPTAAAPTGPALASPPSPPPLPPVPLLRSLQGSAKKVRATPKKERTRFLESLTEPLPIDLDAIGSTDSDE